MPDTISTVLTSMLRSWPGVGLGRRCDAVGTRSSDVNVWMVTFDAAASAATVAISIAASRSVISQPDDSSTACFGPGSAPIAFITARSDPRNGITADSASLFIVLASILISPSQAGSPRHSRASTCCKMKASPSVIRIASYGLTVRYEKGCGGLASGRTLASASRTRA